MPRVLVRIEAVRATWARRLASPDDDPDAPRPAEIAAAAFPLVGIRAAADDKTWLDRAKRQRYVSYLMAGLVGTIGFLMSSKPVLW